MQSSIALVSWWIQLVDASPLENHDELRDQLRALCCAGHADHHRLVWDKGNPIPTAFTMQGCGAPYDFYEYLNTLRPLIGRNEYMIFIMVLAADILDQNAIYHIIVTKNALARIETGKELLAKAKSIVLDTDEEIEAGS